MSNIGNMENANPSEVVRVAKLEFQCADKFIFSQMEQNEFSLYKAEEGGYAVASLIDDNAFGEI